MKKGRDFIPHKQLKGYSGWLTHQWSSFKNLVAEKNLERKLYSLFQEINIFLQILIGFVQKN